MSSEKQDLNALQTEWPYGTGVSWKLESYIMGFNDGEGLVVGVTWDPSGEAVLIVRGFEDGNSGAVYVSEITSKTGDDRHTHENMTGSLIEHFLNSAFELEA